MTEDLYDPADHTVGEVLEYTDGADLSEVQRVYDAEEAGKARSTLLETLSKQLEVKGWSTPEPEAEPVTEAEPVPAEADDSPQPEPASAAPEPEPAIHAGGHVLTEDKGWVPEEGL